MREDRYAGGLGSGLGYIIGAVSLSEEQAAAIFPGLDEFLRLMSDL